MNERISHRMGAGGNGGDEKRAAAQSHESSKTPPAETTPAKPRRLLSAFAFNPPSPRSENIGRGPKKEEMEWGVNDKPRVPKWPDPPVRTYRPEDENVSFYGEPRKPDASGFTDLTSSAIPGPIETRGGMHPPFEAVKEEGVPLVTRKDGKMKR